MKEYNCTIENGMKSAYYGLLALKEEKDIVDEDIDKVIVQLGQLIIKAQNGDIEHIPDDFKGVTVQTETRAY
jgi:hypothetical protein